MQTRSNATKRASGQTRGDRPLADRSSPSLFSSCSRCVLVCCLSSLKYPSTSVPSLLRLSPAFSLYCYILRFHEPSSSSSLTSLTFAYTFFVRHLLPLVCLPSVTIPKLRSRLFTFSYAKLIRRNDQESAQWRCSPTRWTDTPLCISLGPSLFSDGETESYRFAALCRKADAVASVRAGQLDWLDVEADRASSPRPSL
jgi:hypothetical protein